MPDGKVVAERPENRSKEAVSSSLRTEQTDSAQV